MKVFEDHNILAIATLGDDKITLIDLSKNEITKEFQALNGQINDFIIVDEWIYVCGAESKIRAYNIKSGEQIEYFGYQGIFTSLTSYLGKFLISG